ncbi:hypothetical protein [Bradyrhizobium sp. AZCC 2230]|uniref:hypothetical protein n=1 Tax=Bradyrhizobium sp. AZCC 2230 TaxID=3117021 RepID=UPI002FEEC6DF
MNDSSNPAAFGARQLRLWLATLSPGDLSVNEAAAARPGSTVATGVRSANDALWSQMERVGWTQRITDELLSIPGVTSAYVLTEAGARAVTTELAAIATVIGQMVGKIEGRDPHTAPERVRRLCDIVGALFLRTTCQSTLAREAKPAGEDAQARQREYLLALDEILTGVSTAGIFITDAIAHGPDSDVGLDLLERSTAGLHYADQCLTDWAAKMRTEQYGNLPS